MPFIGHGYPCDVAELFSTHSQGQSMGMAFQAFADEIDLRSLPAAQRHRNVLRNARALTVGTSFVFVTDRDPEPFYYQLQTQHRHEFFWNYLDRGPSIWRVQVGRLQNAP